MSKASKPFFESQHKFTFLWRELALLRMPKKRASMSAAQASAAKRSGTRYASGDRASCHGIRQTLEGSFSAVSKPNFASKYAFESSRRDLHNALLCTAPKSHFFQKKISRICQNLRKVSEILRNSQFFKPVSYTHLTLPTIYSV